MSAFLNASPIVFGFWIGCLTPELKFGGGASVRFQCGLSLSELIKALADLLLIKLAVLVAQIGQLRRQPQVGGVRELVGGDALDLTTVLRVDTTSQRVALGLGGILREAMPLRLCSQLLDLRLALCARVCGLGPSRATGQSHSVLS